MFSGISLSDTMLVTAVGIAIVFLVLLILIFIFTLFGVAANIKKRDKAPKTPPVKTDIPVSPVSPKPVENNDDELIAVISAAAMEYLSSDNKTYAISSIKPSKPRRSAWATAGIAQNNSSFTK